MKIYPGEPLNILHTIGLKTMYPIVRCQIDFAQPLNNRRLKQAVQLVGEVVPQIFGRYDLEQNAFIVEQVNPDNMVQTIDMDMQPDALPLDFLQGPQLMLYLQTRRENCQRLTIIISHILSDGAGFKELLYLLVDCYNRGASAVVGQHNDQRIVLVQTLVDQFGKMAQQVSDHPREPLFLPQLADHGTPAYYVDGIQLSAAETAQLKAIAKTQQVTLNDIFLAAFGQIIQQYSGVQDLTLACPTDMRQFFPAAEPRTLRVANFTARYNLILRDTLNLPLVQIVQNIHKQMQIFKLNKQFLQSVADLLKRAQIDSVATLQQVAEANYHVRPIAYTNFGILDADRLQFDGTAITHFILTGSFRRAPMFQVAISMFADRLTLAFNMIGSDLEYRFGMMILRQMKQNMLALMEQ